MTARRFLFFDHFQLDTENECLWRGEQALQLTPKVFALLRHLAEHPGQLVTKDELLNVVWPEVVVSEGVLTTHIGILRQALGDDAKAPRYIETVHRRGYRFIAPLNTTDPAASSQYAVASRRGVADSFQLTTENWQLTTALVGRELELQQLHGWLAKVLSGERQIVFVTGEAGIGKTAVVDAFVAQVAAEQDLWLGQGQCIEQFGAGEAYLPVLTAFSQLGRETRGQRLVEVLSQHAPTWLMQLPALLKPADLDPLQRKTQGATRKRMLREMAEALEALTANHPLVLTLEDLHWSDPSTLELLSFLARRRQPARLLVLGTYRPVEVLANGHPLRAVTQELQLHRHCKDLPLRLLNEEDIAQYLATRVAQGAPGRVPLQNLAHLIHRRTEGNPLFMVTIIDNLIARDALDRQDIEVNTPPTLRQMIERQSDHLTPAEQQVLEVASVAGAEFSAAAVAAGIGSDTTEIETCCADLARREQFLRRSGSSSWPDGTVAACYRFHHALYQEVVYERVVVSRRGALHQRIGERLEGAYKEQAREVAAELAMHFERGRDYQRAVHYLEQAGKNAIQRSAHVEAISHLTKGLGLLKTLPDTPEREQQELTLQLALGPPLQATKGYAALEVEQTYARARELCWQLGETAQLFPVLRGLCGLYLIRGELQTANELGDQMLRLAQSVQDPALFLEAHHALGQTLFFLGELAMAREHLEQGIALYDPQHHHSHTFLYGQDPGVACLAVASWVLWVLGYPDQALKRIHQALTLAQELSHPFMLAYALNSLANVHVLRREEKVTQECSETLIALSREQGFSHWVTTGTIRWGWALAERGRAEEGIAQIRQGMVAFRAATSSSQSPLFLALLAEAYGRAGQVEEGLGILAEALEVIHKHGENYFHTAELYRFKGELTLQKEARGWRLETSFSSPQAPSFKPSVSRAVAQEAEACFLKAIEIARQQSAKSLELRAVMSLSRLWQSQGKTKQAHKMLAEIYGWFTEGFDTKDLQEAKALIEELNH